MNPAGCRECFCSGASSSCSAGVFYRDEIPVFMLDENHGFTVTDRDAKRPMSNDFHFDPTRNEIKYLFDNDESIYYWSLPKRLTGNQILSYGGKLHVTQRTEGSGAYFPDQDVILKGNGIVLYWTRKRLEEQTYSVPLEESEWQSTARSGPRPASRSDLLTVLANLEHILVRASLRAFTSESAISDISLETAVKHVNKKGSVDDIEVCMCPQGYRGSSCEVCIHYFSCSVYSSFKQIQLFQQCDSLFYRDPYDNSKGLLGACKPCPCENADSCEMGSNRRVQCRCKDGYSGDQCREVGKSRQKLSSMLFNHSQFIRHH